MKDNLDLSKVTSTAEFADTLINICEKFGSAKAKTRHDLIKILKHQSGGKHFQTIGNCVFTTNKHGVIKGIGYTFPQGIKIWNNKLFGTFETPVEKEHAEKEISQLNIIDELAVKI